MLGRELPMQERFQRYDQYKEAQQARRAREKEVRTPHTEQAHEERARGEQADRQAGAGTLGERASQEYR